MCGRPGAWSCDVLTPDQLAALGDAARAVVRATDPAMSERLEERLARR